MELAEYKPFGSFSRKEVDPSVSSPSSSTTKPYYTGKRLDSSTGLYYYGARYYDPELGRFIQPDTIVQAPSDPQTLNRYTYARNNPLIYTDPTGHSFWKKVGRILRKWVAPIAAVVATVFLGPLAGIAVYNYYSVTGANLERGRGYFESVGRGFLAGATTLAFGSIAGGAASAALTGQDPGRGALLGLVQGAAAAVGAGMGVPANPFVAVAQAAAIGAASGAAGAAIVGGDPLQGAWMGAASAAAMAAAFIAAGNIQAALDAGSAQGGQEGRIGVVQAINKAAKTEFGQTPQGRSVVRALRVAYHDGRIGFGDLGSSTRAVTNPANMTITVNTNVHGLQLVGRLVHEGTHLVQIGAGQPYTLASERAAFDNGFAVGRDIETRSFHPSNDWLRESYPRLSDDLN